MTKAQREKEESERMLDKGMHASVSLRKLEPRKLQVHNSREEQLERQSFSRANCSLYMNKNQLRAGQKENTAVVELAVPKAAS